ncbi:MAG TPA: M23 family metallopeptidase [Desulfobacteraceae bacterium]|nr:M23 family metallopeptidase [Desulfobacteraceae bacterium]
MIKKKAKIWFHSGSSSRIKEFSISKKLLFACFTGILALSAILAWAGWDYYRLKVTSLDNRVLTERLNEKTSEIESQRKQIQKFAHKINTLTSRVVNLAEFENKVRIIANIEQDSDSSQLFGTGGLPGDELDPKIPATEKHNSLMRKMHEQLNQMDTVSYAKLSDYATLAKELGKKRNILAATPSIRPVKGWVTSSFGYRKSPFTGKKEFHSGLDIANRKGTKIVATAKGTVSLAREKMFIGKVVVIDHGHGTVTKFGHLDKILVKRGETVNRGDVIGFMGNTGRSTGPHVHYEITISGVSVNPEKYILN